MASEDELTPMLDEIADVIGRDNVEKLIEHFGGEQIYITTRKRLGLESRNMQIYEARKKENLHSRLQGGSGCRHHG